MRGLVKTVSVALMPVLRISKAELTQLLKIVFLLILLIEYVQVRD